MNPYYATNMQIYSHSIKWLNSYSVSKTLLKICEIVLLKSKLFIFLSEVILSRDCSSQKARIIRNNYLVVNI